MTRIVETKFISTAGKLEKLPEVSLPEVAFAGRSNVGKSSLLNALTGRKNLFKVSKTPGRTRTIVHVETRFDDNQKIYLVDLPGYGYAKASRGALEAWGQLIEAYLTNRTTLHLVVLLVDVRRGLGDLEFQLLEFLQTHEVPAVLVATKIDRVPKSKQKAELFKLQKDTGVRVIGTSATDKIGLEQLFNMITRSCGL